MGQTCRSSSQLTQSGCMLLFGVPPSAAQPRLHSCLRRHLQNVHSTCPVLHVASAHGATAARTGRHAHNSAKTSVAQHERRVCVCQHTALRRGGWGSCLRRRATAPWVLSTDGFHAEALLAANLTGRLAGGGGAAGVQVGVTPPGCARLTCCAAS